MIPANEELMQAFEQRHGKLIQNRLSSSVAAVCGLGGLGSNIAVSLARAGVGKLILIDFDRVDISNIHRQQYKLSQIGMYKTAALRDNIIEALPYADLELHNTKLDENNCLELLKSADVICEAFDNPQCKAMLVNSVCEALPDKYIVAASGMAGIGSPNSIVTRKITDRLYLCGDGRSGVQEGEGLFSTRVMLCAAHQAHTALRLLVGASWEE